MASVLIVLLLISVLSAINFNYQLGFQANKINDKWADNLLSTKFTAQQLPIPDLLPNHSFGVGLISA
ncbi:hypothetical protein A1332_02010 [Methylomonas methanica]|uniref:Uncharacterized protein n=1 Tax=Methylomonas methanica TaxID=421 RepID=A0A177MI45_METMH|nr:hypothetical protein A1332_02010 [Methylomonas methanica]